MEIKNTRNVSSLYISTDIVNGEEITEFECSGDFESCLTDLSLAVFEVAKTYREDPGKIIYALSNAINDIIQEDDDEEDDEDSGSVTKVIPIRKGENPELDKLIEDLIAEELRTEGELN